MNREETTKKLIRSAATGIDNPRIDDELNDAMKAVLQITKTRQGGAFAKAATRTRNRTDPAVE